MSEDIDAELERLRGNHLLQLSKHMFARAPPLSRHFLEQLTAEPAADRSATVIWPSLRVR